MLSNFDIEEIANYYQIPIVVLPEPHGHIMAACSISCSHTPRRNEPYDCQTISSPRPYTTYELASQTIKRLLYAVTIRPKSLYIEICVHSYLLSY